MAAGADPPPGGPLPASPHEVQAMSRVLIIEDSATQALQFTRVLEKAGFQVERTELLAPGLERLAAGGIDAVLLDLTLPDSEGLETFFRVRGVTQNPPVPVVILTGT